MPNWSDHVNLSAGPTAPALLSSYSCQIPQKCLFVQRVFKDSTTSKHKLSYLVLAISRTISSMCILTALLTPWTQHLGMTRVHKQPSTQSVCPEELYNSCSHICLFQESSSCYVPVTTAGQHTVHKIFYKKRFHLKAQKNFFSHCIHTQTQLSLILTCCHLTICTELRRQNSQWIPVLSLVDFLSIPTQHSRNVNCKKAEWNRKTNMLLINKQSALLDSTAPILVRVFGSIML